MLTQPQEICVHPVIVWEVAALIRHETEVLSDSLDICWNPISGLRRWGHEGRRQLGHEGRVLMSRISALNKRDPRKPPHTLYCLRTWHGVLDHVWGHCLRTWWGFISHQTLTLPWFWISWSPELCEINVCYFSHPVYGIFVITAPDAFEIWWWRRLLRVPWTERSNQSNQ